jgi:hypothetical protein
VGEVLVDHLDLQHPHSESLVSKTAVTNFVHALIAVLGGNALYFLVMPYLPEPAQHVAPRIDLGLAVDFWVCLVVLGVVKFLAGRRKAHSKPNES